MLYILLNKEPLVKELSSGIHCCMEAKTKREMTVGIKMWTKRKEMFRNSFDAKFKISSVSKINI